MKVLLSDSLIANEPLSSDGNRILRDEKLKGFFLMIGKRSKTFVIQGDLRTEEGRTSVRMKLGRAGQITTREARAKAKVLLGKITAGEDPRSSSKVKGQSEKDPSLMQAWEAYREGHMRRKGRSEKTIAGYADCVERLMKPWLNKPLSYLGNKPALVRAHHSKLSKTSGPYSANIAMRTLRAIYNHARKASPNLPPQNPVYAVDWNPEERRDSGMGIDELESWFQQLSQLENPLRRELHLLLLLSGSRPAAMRTIRLSNVDLVKREIFIPLPKGGKVKAFSIPLSRQMILSVIRAIRLGRIMYPSNETWLFPAESEQGHMIEHKERRNILRYWGNELRQSYRNMGQMAEVMEVDMHLLMNHSLPGVNAGYLTRQKIIGTHLRHAQQRISDVIMRQATGGSVDQSSDIEWTNSGRISENQN